MRTMVVTIPLYEEEIKRLDETASRYAISRSVLLRMLLKSRLENEENKNLKNQSQKYEGLKKSIFFPIDTNMHEMVEAQIEQFPISISRAQYIRYLVLPALEELYGGNDHDLLHRL